MRAIGNCALAAVVGCHAAGRMAAEATGETGSVASSESSAVTSDVSEPTAATSTTSVASSESGSGDTAATTTGETTTTGPAVPPPGSTRADVLFVVDDTVGSGDAQARLAWAVPALVEGLDAAALDYRIAVTSTDYFDYNPDEPGKIGHFIATSCRSRLSSFVHDDAPYEDATQACIEVCAHEQVVIEPTATENDPDPRPRPWIESSATGNNVGDGVSVVAALRCIIPQGITGGRYEQPLMAMNYGITRSVDDANDDEDGFFRADATWVLVLVTNEVECSYRFPAIFSPMGNRVFWADPTDEEETAAVCWNAGVACTGGPGTYDECHPADFDLEGNPTEDPDAAVMWPFDAFFQKRLEDWQAAKELGPVMVFGIAGVPIGYENGDPIFYADASDPDEQHEYGIGSICEGDGILARPAVRVRELTEAMAPPGDTRIWSVCADEYDTALAGVAAAVIDAIP